MENQFGSHWLLNKRKHFEILNVEKSSYIIEDGSSFMVSGVIQNNVQEYATTYLIVKFANAYNQHEHVLFDTDRDLVEGAKEALRIVDIPPLGTSEFCVSIDLPKGSDRQTLDMRIELWSPQRRTWQKSSIDTIALFYRSNWGNGVDVIKKEDLVATAFISYSWFSDEHVKWVNTLAQELARRQIKAVLDQKDLAPGQEITRFMDSGSKQPICICVCSSNYTEKANSDGSGGVRYEISSLTNQILKGRLRTTIIPIVRDNPDKAIPDFLGSARYLDFDMESWRGKPLTELAASIVKSRP